VVMMPMPVMTSTMTAVTAAPMTATSVTAISIPLAMPASTASAPAAEHLHETDQADDPDQKSNHARPPSSVNLRQRCEERARSAMKKCEGPVDAARGRGGSIAAA
jgi:hypothetical protein